MVGVKKNQMSPEILFLYRVCLIGLPTLQVIMFCVKYVCVPDLRSGFMWWPMIVLGLIHLTPCLYGMWYHCTVWNFGQYAIFILLVLQWILLVMKMIVSPSMSWWITLSPTIGLIVYFVALIWLQDWVESGNKKD